MFIFSREIVLDLTLVNVYIVTFWAMAPYIPVGEC